ncbi:MAG TPA: hypothetical protein VGC65_02385 [Bacteroidia bacterium]|jgi:hypothetical protein
MKKDLPLLCLFLLVGFRLSAGGNYKATYKEAEEYFVNENYTAALPLYLQLDSLEKDNANINFKIGLCYLKAATYKTKAIPYLERAMKNIARKYQEGELNEKEAPLSTSYYLAKAYHFNYQFDKAIEMYKKYIAELGTDPKLAGEIEEINHDIETCNYGKELVKDSIKVMIENVGDGINTKYPEYAPVVSLDEQTLIFTTRREGGASASKLPNGEFFEDIFISTYDGTKWGKATTIGTNINTKGHEATINLSADGQKLLIYKDDGGNGNVYMSELKGNEWGTPEYASAPVNSSSWESHACFSSDNRILYFVSDRSGGYGGRDIYKCLKLPNGEWGPVENLGDVINTKYDEDGVFIHPDGKQIFFSSKGHNSVGGFDIFTSLVNDENGFWSKPVNYGFPVNTTDDDVFLITTADGKRSFFSSDKEGGYGEKDIYMIRFPDNEPRDITVLLGKINNNSKESIGNNKIYIINSITKDTVQVLSANSSSGKFGTNLPIGATYNIIFKVNGKELYNDVVDVPKGKGYQVIKRDDITFNGDSLPLTRTDLNSTNSSASHGPCDPQSASFQLFFKYNKKEINTNSSEFNNFIAAISTCLKNDPTLVVEIESSASMVPTTTFSNNGNLADLRAKDAKEKTLQALLKKGVKESQVVFGIPTTLVQGPDYQKDAIEKMTTYEQFQYIKISAVQKK